MSGSATDQSGSTTTETIVVDPGKESGVQAGTVSSPGAAGTSADGGDGTPAAGTAQSADSGAVPAGDKDDKKTEDWRDRRIAQLTARLREKEQQPTKVEEKVEAETVDPNEFERRVALAAEERAQIKAFNDACNETAEQGKKLFPDFGEKITALTKLVDTTSPEAVAKYNAFLLASIETGEGPKLLHQLGSDLNEAERILGLSPVKMAVELAKLSTKTATGGSGTGTSVSGAPKPISPVGQRGAQLSDIDPGDPERADSLPVDLWMKRREEQTEKRRKERYA